MADTPRRFEWLAGEDGTSTHLALRPGGVYDSSVVSHHVLLQWEREGKLRFLEDDVTVVLPADVVLQVQNATIGLTALVKAVRDGIKEERNG